MRFSSGEALARVIAEKGNPQVDVLFGGPVETFTAGIRAGRLRSLHASPDAADAAGPLQGCRTASGPRSPTIRWCS